MSKKDAKRASMMVLAQQEASQRKNRDLSQIGGGEFRSQGFGQFMNPIKS
jgi:hypothetical protein|tara:strand:- start:456 stop:605 length:150 start_codon:yes stop_codon:yes gene_type:complete